MHVAVSGKLLAAVLLALGVCLFLLGLRRLQATHANGRQNYGYHRRHAETVAAASYAAGGDGEPAKAETGRGQATVLDASSDPAGQCMWFIEGAARCLQHQKMSPKHTDPDYKSPKLSSTSPMSSRSPTSPMSSLSSTSSMLSMTPTSSKSSMSSTSSIFSTLSMSRDVTGGSDRISASRSHLAQTVGMMTTTTSRSLTSPKDDLTPDGNQMRHLVVKLIGGLGNQLWILASAYGMARLSNRTVYACTSGKYVSGAVFPGLAADVRLVPAAECVPGAPGWPRGALRVTQLPQKGAALYFDVAMVARVRDAPGHVTVCCYLQNLGFFLPYEDEVKQMLDLAEPYRAGARGVLAALTGAKAAELGVALGRDSRGRLTMNATTLTFVMVHVRRTDMSAMAGVVTPGARYFEKAMGLFRSRYRAGAVLFVVATDDQRWARTNLSGPDIIFTGNDVDGAADGGNRTRTGLRRRRRSRRGAWVGDFSVALECNHTIISLGTFGWWMGYLNGGGQVVYFTDWVGTSRLAKWYLPGQRYPYNWIGL